MLALLAFPLAAALASPPAVRLTPEQAREIGLKIWHNEAGGQVRLLTDWNKGEAFGSFGIGHFIWYPAGERGPFTESFPGALDAIAASGAALPAWLRGHPHCPWPNREAFYKDFDGERLTALRALLASTVDAQAMYAVARMENSLPEILAAAESSERAALQARFDAVAAAPNGVYALVDYVNFKGEGVNPSERYDGLGWGLLQVLELMGDAAPGQPAVEAFELGAEAALKRRVAHAPPGRRALERGWLPGWLARVKTYLEP